MNEQAKKKALRMIPYGLYVLTASDGQGVNAALVSWVSQASFEPPRVVVALGNETGIWHRVRTAGAFVLNVLGSGQKEVATAFFRGVGKAGDLLAGYRYHSGVVGSPILDDAPAYLECRVVANLDAGDHTLFLADIVEAGLQNDLPPLRLEETPWNYGG